MRPHFLKNYNLGNFHPGGTLWTVLKSNAVQKIGTNPFFHTYYSNYVSVSYKRDFMTLSNNELTKKSCRFVSDQV